MTTDLPSRARVVIIGGGVIGTSVAYHLTKLGWTDVLLLEQGTLSGGTTWHAAGWSARCGRRESGTRLVQYSAELYARLEEETGLATGYRQVGGVIVARTEDRMVQLRRTAANAAAYDMECALLTPDEALEKWPVMARRRPARRALAARRRQGQPDRPDHGAGQGRPAAAAPGSSSGSGSPASTSTDGPAGPRVTGVAHRTGATSRPRWSSTAPASGPRRSADQVGVTVPLHSAEHFYVVTDAARGRAPGPADPARPRRLDLLQGGGRRPRGGRLRAGGQAVALAGRRSRTRSSSSCSRRTGSTSRC